MTKEEIIKKYDQKRMGGAQNSASSKSALSKEEVIKKYDERQAAKTRERQMIEIASRTPEEVMKSTYQSYIPEEYKGTFENVNIRDSEKIEILKNTMGADVFNYNDIAEHMTEDELKLLKKIHEENGLDILSGDSKHNAYIKGLREEIDRRRIETAAYNARKNDGLLGKVGTSVKSVGNNLMSVATMEGVGNAINGLLGHEIDETPYYQTMAEVQRQAVSEDMSGFGKFLYNTGMSMADSAVMTAIGALIGGGAGAAATKVAEAVTMIGMGSQAMSSTIADAKQRGKDDVNAVLQGVLAGIAEAYFEKRGLGALFDSETFKKSIGKYLLANVFQNAVEEAETEAANIIADSFIEFDKSNFNKAMQEYKSQGMSDAGAAGRALLSSLGDVALSAASGALMGLGSGGAGVVGHTIKTNAYDVRTGRQITELAHANTDLYGAAKLAEDAEINKILDAVYKAKEGSRAKYRLTGKLARQTGGVYQQRQNGRFTPQEMDQQEIDIKKEEYVESPFEREYGVYSEKVGTAAAVDLEEEAKALAAKDAGEDYGEKYEGETRDAYYKGLANYKNKEKAYQYPLWFEIARKMGQDSNGRSVDEMIKTLPFSDRKGVLYLDTDTIKAAFNDGKRIAEEIAEEQKAADERRKRGEERIAERKRAVEAEKGKESTEGEKTTSTTGENKSNVQVSDEVKKAEAANELSPAQKTALKKIRQVMKYIPGYEVIVQKANEYDSKLGNENGYFDPSTRTIYLNIDAGKVTGKIKIRGQDVAVELYEAALESALTHEIGHAIRVDSPKLWSELRDFIRTQLYREGGFQNLVKQRQRQYAAALGREIGYEYAEEEVICNSLGDILTSERVMDELAGTHRNLFARIWRLVKDFFSKILKRMRGMDGDFSYKTPEQKIVEKKLLTERRRLEDLFVKALRDASATSKATLALGKSEAQKNVAKSSENATETAENAENTQKTATQPQKNNGLDNGKRSLREDFVVGKDLPTNPTEAKVENKVDDLRFSLAYSDTIAKAQREYQVRSMAKISAKELDLAIEQTAEMVSIMEAYADILPQDKVTRKTLVKNGSYDYSVENTTICVRTLAYNAFVEMVSEKIKRPLSQMESFLVSQKLYEIAKEPQCLYCYVSLDRKAYNEMVLRYIEQRDIAIADYEAAGKPVVNDKLRNDKSGIYHRFLDGRKDTDNMWDRYRKWITQYNMGIHLLTAEDVATEKRRADLAASGGVNAEQVTDILKYAQSASWAKKQLDYTAYNGEILKLSPRIVSNLNKHYGLRWYSFSDYTAAFIVENMQQITDASLRGLKGLSYTKDTDYARIFAPTGMNINVSVYVTRDTEGNYVIDERQSANLEEAIALREQYPNVGIVAVATDTEGVEWALAQEWTDVVIPFHTVRTGAQVAEFYDWTVFNEEQSDSVSDENLWDRYADSVAKSDAAKKKVSKMIYPSEHQNDRAKYLALVKERGLKPRFSQFLDNPNYMKLVNETRQSESETKPLQPIYDLEAAKESFGKFVDKGGYFEGWYNDGIDAEAEADVVAADVLAGKRPDQVDYAVKNASWERAMERRKDNRSHGRYSIKESLEGKFSLRDTLAREQLSAMFYEMAATPVEREIVEKYQAEIVNIDAKIDERREILERLSEIEGKSGFGGERERLEGRLKGVNAYITGRDRRLFELESAKPFKEMVERYDAELAKKRESAPKALSSSRYAYVSRGRYNELIAKEKGEKFYTQKDAQVVEKRIAGFDKLSRRKKNIIVDELWQGMNAAKTEAEREGVIRSVRDMIFAEIERSAKIENPEYADIEQTLLYLSGYVQRLSFTDEMKGEIRHKLDESGAKSFMGRWQNKKSDGKAVPAETFVTDFAREVDGYAYLEDMNAADALFEIDELYGRLKNVDETVDAFYDASSAELQAILDNIEESVREAFQEGGHEVTPGNGTLTAQAIKQREEAKARAKEKVDEVMSYHKATLAADREARSIRDLKRGTFDNATEIKGDRVMELLRELGKFEYRGTFSVNNFREKVRGLNEWYHSDNAKNLLNKTKTEDGEYSEFIANTLQQISSGKGRVTADELWAFSKVLAHFRRIAEGYNKVWRAGKWEDALPIAQRYVGTLKLSRDLKGANTFFQKVYRMYFNEFADPLSVVRRYDGYIEDGYFTDMFLMFRDAAVELETTHSDVMKDYHTFLDKKENKHYLRDLQERYVEVYGERIPMEQALSLYMMLRQDHALMGFVDGGVQYKGFDGDMHMARSLASKANIELKIQLMAKEVAKDYGISMKEAEAKARETVTSDTFKTEDMTIDELRAAVKPTMDAIKEKMTDADRELLSIIEKSMNGTLRELKRATDLERLGFSNVMQGFYFPIKRAGTAEKVETLAYNDELQSVSNISANKSREQGARQPLRIDSIIKTYERHAKAIVTYATMQQAVDFYDRIYNVSVTGNPNDAEKVATAANEVWGPRKAETRGNHAFFKELIADIQGLKTGKESIFNDMVGLLRGGMATAGIGLNGKVLLSQWSSYAAALPEMSFGSLMKAAAKRFGIGAKGIFSKEGREALIEYGKIVDEYCPLARVRHEENYAYLAQGVIEKDDGTVKVKGKVTEGLNEFREATMKPIGWMDRAVVCTLFEACKYETATADAPLDSEENLKAAGKKLEEVILNTQQNALATEKSRAMRSDQELMKGLVMFSSDSMRSLSRFLDYAGELHSINRQLKTFQMSDAAKETLQSRKKEVGSKLRNSIIAISANAIWMAALTLFFRFMRGKKIEREDILEDLALDIFTGYFGGMPLLRDLVDQVTKGYGVTDSALDSIGDFVGAFTSVFTTISKVIQGEREWGALVGQLRKFAFAIAQVTGIPVRNVWNCIYGWINIFSKDTADAIEGFLAG